MKLSIIIPAHNEEGSIRPTVTELARTLNTEKIDYEILVVNDNSSDSTEQILTELSQQPNVLYVNNDPPNGFGFAVRKGLNSFSGDAVTLFMADSSDAPEDVVKFFRKLEEGYDCVFGSRFIKGGKTYDYPFLKLVLCL